MNATASKPRTAKTATAKTAPAKTAPAKKAARKTAAPAEPTTAKAAPAKKTTQKPVVEQKVEAVTPVPASAATTTLVRPNLKVLHPRSPDTKYIGEEPQWATQPTAENRVTRLSRALNWYNYFYGKKEAKDFVATYLDWSGRKNDAKKIRSLGDSKIRLTPGWTCRMVLMGLELTEREQGSLDRMITEMLESKEKDVPEEAVVEVASATPKITIQDRLREKVQECAGEIDGIYDEFLTSGAKMTANVKPIATIRGMNISPQMVGHISDIWKKHQAELEEAVAGKDAQLVEGYSSYSKIQMRNMIKFCEAVINDCNAYVQIKKVERKPRKIKPVSPEKRAAKFKCMITFDELKIKGLPAASLVDKAEAWLYDTKKRKLVHLVADSHTQYFTVKSNSIIGFSTVETKQKTVRKPADVLKAIQAAGKPNARKIFKDLTTTETPFTGRGNENLLILKAW